MQKASLRQVPLGWLGGHGISLLVVLLAWAVGQVAMLAQRPLISLSLDSAGYLAVADRIVHHLSVSSFLDAMRTPGYPAFLAGLEALGIYGDAIAYAQAPLLLLTMLVAYALAWELTRQRWVAVLVAAVLGVNIFFLAWERTVMSEEMEILAVMLAAFCFWRWLKERQSAWAAAFCLVSIMVVLIRPSFIYLPLALAAVVWLSQPRRWRQPLLVAAVAYAAVGGYTLANNHTYPNAYLSSTSSMNSLGKVLEYHMEGEGNPARYPALYQAAQMVQTTQTTQGPFRDPYSIDPSVLGANYIDAGRFSQEIILHHPLEYASKSVVDFAKGWNLEPLPYAPVSCDCTTQANQVGWLAWVVASEAGQKAYLVTPLMLLALLLLWRRIERKVAWALAGLGLVVLGERVTSALLGYVFIDRFRSPVVPLAVILLAVVAVQIVVVFSRARKQAKKA